MEGVFMSEELQLVLVAMALGSKSGEKKLHFLADVTERRGRFKDKVFIRNNISLFLYFPGLCSVYFVLIILLFSLAINVISHS